MSATMVRKVSQYHDRLARAMAPLIGQELTQAKVRVAYATAYPKRQDDIEWLMPADHCLDHSNRGACQCSRTDGAIFERLGHNRYRVRSLGGQMYGVAT